MSKMVILIGNSITLTFPRNEHTSKKSKEKVGALV